MSRSVWLIPLVSLSDPHIYVIYTSTEVHQIQYMWHDIEKMGQWYSRDKSQSDWFPWSVCLMPTSMSYIHPQKSIKYNICVPTISLTHPLYVMSRSVWLIPLVSLPDPHIYVIYTSTKVHQIQYMCPYYITDTSPLCHVKVSLTDSPGQSAWSPHLCHIYNPRSPHYTIYVSLLYHWPIFSMSCQGQSGWFPWSVCLIPTSMSYIHPQKSIKYNICVPTISLTHPLYVMSRSVWLIPLVSLADPHICVIYTSTEVHQIQYMCPYYITDPSSLCHVKVSLADSPGQSVWSPHLCHIYIHRSPSNTIYLSLLYHWPIPSMSCQGQSDWFPLSVWLIPTSMSYIHPQKSIKYNIYVPTISLTYILYVMSRSVWLIPLVSLSDPHIYVIYTSTEVHIIQYMCPYYITDTSPLCHVKVSLTDSPGQSAWSPHLCHIYIHRSPSNTIYVPHLYHWPIFSISCQGQSGWFPWSVCLIPTSMSYIHPQKSTKYNICIPTISLTHPLYVMSRSVLLWRMSTHKTQL